MIIAARLFWIANVAVPYHTSPLWLYPLLFTPFSAVISVLTFQYFQSEIGRSWSCYFRRYRQFVKWCFLTFFAYLVLLEVVVMQLELFYNSFVLGVMGLSELPRPYDNCWREYVFGEVLYIDTLAPFSFVVNLIWLTAVAQFFLHFRLGKKT